MGTKRTESGRMVFLIMASLGMLFYSAERWAFGPLIPSLMEAFHADSTTLGVIGSASMWGYMFIPIVAGLLSDRFGRKYSILPGMFGLSILTVLCGMVNSGEQLFWTRFFTGTFEAFYFVPLAAFTLELFPERPALFLGLLISGAALGWFIGPAAAGWLLDLTGTWRSAFLAMGSAAIITAFLQWWFWPAARSETGSRALFDRAILLPRNLLMLLLLGFVLTFQMASEFGFCMWFPAYLKKEVLMSATGAGVLAGCFGIGQAVGRPIMGIVSDRAGYRRTGIAASMATGIFFMLTLLVARTASMAFFIFMAGFISSAASGGLWTFTGLVFAPFKGFALGAIVSIAYCASSLAPVAMGYIGSRQSIYAALWTVAIPCAFAAAACVMPTFLLKRTKVQSAGYRAR